MVQFSYYPLPEGLGSDIEDFLKAQDDSTNPNIKAYIITYWE